jgi:hypothetical protein
MFSAIAAAPILLLMGGIAEPEPGRTCFEKYDGETPVPEDLYRAYRKLVELMRRGDRDQLSSVSLPGSVRLQTEPRPKGKVELGEELSLPFARERFSPHVRLLRKERDDVYLIRTSTSYLRFVCTRSGAWRLYHYGDKPIR